MQNGSTEVVEQHVRSQGSFEIIAVSVFEDFFVLFILRLFAFLSFGRRLAAIFFCALPFSLGRFFLARFGLVLGALLATVVAFTCKGIKLDLKLFGINLEDSKACEGIYTVVAL